MGHWYRLTPISVKFAREVENLTPKELDAYVLGNLIKVDEENSFGWYLCRVPHIFFGREIPSEAFQYGKPLFNRPETQNKFYRLSPYVVNRMSIGVLIAWGDAYLQEERAVLQYKKKSRECEENIKWIRERLRLLRILERRYSLFILYGW